MMKRIGLLGLMMLLLLGSGCSMTNLGVSFKASQYMASGDYAKAEQEFRDEVRQSPSNALAHYYLGRFLLAREKATEAVPVLERAVALDSRDADFHFWLGVSYGETGAFAAERSSYQNALRLDRQHTQARLYLGHLQLRDGELAQALKSYDEVLKRVPTNGAALYNRALILEMQQQKGEAKEAWLEYLKWFPAGRFAILATDHLNALMDYSYENHHLGNRVVTLSKIALAPSGSAISVESYPSLRLLGAIVSNLQKGTLQVVVYEKGNTGLARHKAMLIQKTILELYPKLTEQRVKISWFKTSEVHENNGKTYSRTSAVRFFLSDWQ